jgi:WD40 repeat protein
LSFGPDGDLYVSSFSSDRVLQYDGASGSHVGTLPAAGGDINGPTGLVFSPMGELLVASYDDNKVLRYDDGTGLFVDFAEGGGLNGPVFLTYAPEPTSLFLLIPGLVFLLTRRR